MRHPLGKLVQFTTSKDRKNVRWTIGDPDKTIGGIHEFEIRYTVKRAFLNRNNAQILYWNVTGHDWKGSINKTQVSIHLPPQAKVQDVKGYLGSQDSVQKILPVDQSTNNLLNLSHKASLPPGLGLTFLVKLDASSTIEPDYVTRAGWFFDDNPVLYIPAFILSINVLLFLLWRREHPQTREQSIRENIHEHLSPGEMGILVNDNFDPHNLSAEIVSLAQKGFLRIEERTSEDEEVIITLKKLTGDTSGLRTHQKELFYSLFAFNPVVTVKELESTFYRYIPKIRNAIVRDLMSRRYYFFPPVRGNKVYNLVYTAFFFMGIMYGIISWHC